jgi:tetratricopeptide (TPR) repeat protein
MKNLKFVSLFILVGVVGCASYPAKSPQASATTPTVKEDPIKPTFNEKVSALNVDDYKTSGTCPKDGAWNGLDWKKILPMANACVKSKDWRKVENIGSYLGMHHSLTPWGAYYMSLAAEARKDLPRAQWMMELALKKAPNEGLFHYQLGRLYWVNEDTVQALKELKTASDNNPTLTDAHWIVGQIALQKGSFKEAEDYLNKALDNNRNHWPALMALATVKTKGKDWAAAELVLIKAIRANPRSLKARMALAEIQELQLKNLSSALQTYKETRQLVTSRKLDEKPGVNLDEKIKTIEQSLSAVSEQKKISARKPTGEKKVAE